MTSFLAMHFVNYLTPEIASSDLSVMELFIEMHPNKKIRLRRPCHLHKNNDTNE